MMSSDLRKPGDLREVGSRVDGAHASGPSSPGLARARSDSAPKGALGASKGNSQARLWLVQIREAERLHGAFDVRSRRVVRRSTDGAARAAGTSSRG